MHAQCFLRSHWHLLLDELLQILDAEHLGTYRLRNELEDGIGVRLGILLHCGLD